MSDKRTVDQILESWGQNPAEQLDEATQQLLAQSFKTLARYFGTLKGSVAKSDLAAVVNACDNMSSQVKDVRDKAVKMQKADGRLREDLDEGRSDNEIARAGWVYQTGGSGEWDAYEPRDKKRKTYLLIYNDGSWEFYKDGERDFGQKDPDKKGSPKDDLPDA